MVRKNYLMVMLALAGITGRSFAQQCATDIMHQKYIQLDPKIAEREQQFNQMLSRQLGGLDVSKYARTTASDAGDVTHVYDIPVVVHIMHNYGNEYVADSEVVKMITDLNKVYSLQNDTSQVIEPFRKYVGNAQIRFHLATKDQYGNRTKGITRRFTYLTYGGDDQVKMDQWPPSSYYNVWIENVIGRATAGGTVLAYATFPTSAASFPYYDGIICASPYIHATHTIEHETGHYLGLYHPWNSSGGDAGAMCGDDQVDDTPPTTGSYSCNLYDTTCASNYFKIYTSVSGADSMVDYPDTVNKQNIMDYATCPNMFTKGQAYRMRSTLDASVAARDNLTKPWNLTITGANDPYPDLPPIPDFTVRTSVVQSSPFAYFALPGTNVTFYNKSWNDTVTAVNWTFGNGASVSTSTSATTVNVNFSQGGWAPVTMAVTGNNSGTTTTVFDRKVFVADPNPAKAENYFQEFDRAEENAKWPTFNYYGNEFKWEMANTGLYDGSSIRYHGFDNRVDITSTSTPVIPYTGTPRGDYDDLFSSPIDLSAFPDYCNLNFWYSAASRTSVSTDIRDTLFIDYSANKSNTWINLAKLTKGDLINRGSWTTEYKPSGMQDWAPKTIPLPTGARTGYTVFRFRYKPGVSPGMILGESNILSTGNDFYMDRISFSRNPAEATQPGMQNASVLVVPNPTNGSAWVVVKNAGNANTHVTVTDVTGKVMYATTQAANNAQQSIEIPHSAISVPGLYMVQVNTGEQVSTQKLVVY